MIDATQAHDCASEHRYTTRLWAEARMLHAPNFTGFSLKNQNLIRRSPDSNAGQLLKKHHVRAQ